ncbi:protein phosphatase Slingshot homolog 1-like isoform X2 [Liolophura sinensis]|uniref:protein phosphatase Slingshot homolog 1-like isoform X2 n=1 Tax=Liolophura sinensis TaxID=3198878 RepID=UPI0031592E9D
MALVTVQRSPSPSNSPEHAESDGGATAEEDRSPLRQRSSFRSKSALKRLRKFFNTIRFVSKLNPCFSESYFAVKGTALILPQSECTRKVTSKSHGGDIQRHLQSMLHLLRPQDTLKVAVKLESAFPQRNRYMAVVSCVGRQDTEECLILGIDCNNDKATIGLVLPIWANTKIKLDGDGGFSINYEETHHLFKPVSVQAMWSALQSLHKVVAVATSNFYFAHGLTHTWVGYYQARISSDQHCITEWHLREDIMTFREVTSVLDEDSEQAALKMKIKAALREVMMTVDLEEVTSKFLRVKLEEMFGMSLQEHKSYVDEEMLVIMGQMDAPTSVFDFLYLGSEWNASNLEELQDNGIRYILNVTREIDNFFPGMFTYMNIREYDVEETDLLKYWEKTYKFISKARKAGSKVLVHCKMGVSRSASTVIAFIMKDLGWSLDETYDYVKQKRSCIKPNKSFMKQLETYQGILNASRQRYIFKSKSETNLQDPEDLLEDLRDTTGEGIFLGANLHLPRPHSWAPEDDIAASILMQKGLAMTDEGLEHAGGIPIFQLGGEEADVELSSRSTDSVEMSLPDIPSPKTVKNDDNTPQFELDLHCPEASKAQNVRRVSPFASPLGSPKGDNSFLPQPSQTGMLGSSWNSTSTPYMFKVRDDSSWIKESSPDTPVAEVPQGKDIPEIITDDNTIPKFATYVTNAYQADPENAEDNSCLCAAQQRLNAVESEPTLVDPSPTPWHEQDSSCKPYSGIREHYAKEAIPWNPGTVKKQLEDFEHRIRSTGPESGDTEQTGIGDPPKTLELQPENTLQDNMQTPQTSYSNSYLIVPGGNSRASSTPQSLEMLTTSSGETSGELGRTRPASVYEIEDIPLPVGIVQRTKQEIEEKQRPTPREWIETSFSDLDPVVKPVQRSSSLKVNNSSSKSKKLRSSDRRKTCTPILSPCMSPDAGGTTPSLFTTGSGSKARKELMLGDADSGVALEELPVQVFKYGNEEVPLALGMVRRHAKDFENLNVEVDQRTKSPSSDIDDKLQGAYVETPESSSKPTVQVTPREITRGENPPQIDQGSGGLEADSKSVGSKIEIVLPEKASSLLVQGGAKEVHAAKGIIDVKRGSDTCQRERVTNSFSKCASDETSGERPKSIRLDKQTLFLIREIGSALLNQPLKIDDDQGDTAENVSNVKQIVRTIERKSKVKTKSFWERIVIIEKDQELSRGCVHASSPPKVDTAASRLSFPKKTEDVEEPSNSSVAGQFSLNGDSEAGVVKRKTGTVTKPVFLPLVVDQQEDREQKHGEVLRIGSPCDELPIDGLEAIEDHLVKNLVGKFEVATEDSKKVVDSKDNSTAAITASPGSDSGDSVFSSPSKHHQQQQRLSPEAMPPNSDQSPLAFRRSSSLEDLWTLHRVSDAASLPQDDDENKESQPQAENPTSDTAEEDVAPLREGSAKLRPKSVIVTSSCTLGTLTSSTPRNRHTIHSLSALSGASGSPHRYLPTEVGQSFSLDGRKVRRLEGKTHPLAKLGWQHSTM